MNINVINRGDNIDILESIMDIPDVDCLVENTPETIENIALLASWWNWHTQRP